MAIVVVGGLLVAAPAEAASPCNVTYDHCYSVGDFAVSNEGATANVRANCMGIPSTAYFITSELWIVKGSEWAEAGIYRGFGNPSTVSLAAFAAEKDDFTGYSETGFTTPALLYNSGYNVSIVESSVGSGSWNANFAGHGAVLTPFPGPAQRVQSGMESTDTTNRTTGFVQALTYYNASRSQVSGWAGAGQVVAGANVTGSWNAAKTRWDYRQNAIC